MTETMHRIMERMGFITSEDVPELTKEYPHLQVLVRAGASRCLCGIHQLNEVFEEVSRKGDYVRDVSLTAENYQRVESGQRPYSLTNIRYNA